MKGKLSILLAACLLLVLAACGQANNQANNGVNNQANSRANNANQNNANQNDGSGKWAALKDKGEIVFGTAGTLYPASYYPEDSDEITGYNVEVMREIAKRLNLDIKFEKMGFDAMLASLKSGRIDVIAEGPSENDQQKFLFSDPFKYSYSTMIVRGDGSSNIHKLTDLKGKKAGGAATTTYSDIARKYGAEVKTYGNATNDVYLRDVDNGRTDVIINDYYLQKLALTAFSDLNLKIQPDLKFHPTTVNVVMDKDAIVLQEKINDVLQEMQSDGTLTKLSKQFFDGSDVSKKPEEPIKKIPGIDKK